MASRAFSLRSNLCFIIVRTAAVAFALTICSAFAMAEELFLQSQSSSSGRYAVLEDDGFTAFLYLTESRVPKPVKDAVVYSRVPPAEKVDWKETKKSGAAPRLTAEVASSSAVVEAPKASEFTFLWSIDGESVAVLRNGIPVAMATTKERLGYSKAVKVASPIANPWQEDRFTTLFRQGNPDSPSSGETAPLVQRHGCQEAASERLK